MARPVVNLVLVAADTTVQQVLRIICTTTNLRLVMVDCKFTASISLGYTTILAREIGATAHVSAYLSRNCHAACEVGR